MPQHILSGFSKQQSIDFSLFWHENDAKDGRNEKGATLREFSLTFSSSGKVSMIIKHDIKCVIQYLFSIGRK